MKSASPSIASFPLSDFYAVAGHFPGIASGVFFWGEE